ncbi:MAG: hypothetical protein IT238_09365 [Bacteroidia bacterium]|nr:hypothetical protein [Bacteroidia bacterium]MCZ2248174.1 hypothetical protein [Bacteroidia bacterium]
MKRFTIISITACSLIILLSGLMHADIIFTAERDNAFLTLLKEKFINFNNTLPQDRVFIHTDKYLYNPGETMWFSVYLRDAKSMKASEMSDIVQIQIVAPKGNIEKEFKLICKDGKAAGDFLFAGNCVGGIYKIRAFSQWQKNEPDSIFFEKEINVQQLITPRLKMKLEFDRKSYGKGDEVIALLNLESNDNKVLSNFPFEYAVKIADKEINRSKATTDHDGNMHIKFKLPTRLSSNDGLLNVMMQYDGMNESISRSIPIVLNNITLKFYPEGGDLIDNLTNKVAFKATDEFGKPADIEGVVLDSKGNKITDFKSYFRGMGSFALLPKPDESYTARITSPVGIEAVYGLPQALNEGFVLNVTEQNSSSITVAVNALDTQELSLTAQIRGKIYYSTAIDAKNGTSLIKIPIKEMPIGVCQITLFNHEGIPENERLVFVNRDKKLNVVVKTDKEKYMPREKVKATIKVSDSEGHPVAANLSLNVTNDELLVFADDKQGNIISKLYLEPDVKGKIEEPNFYFTNDSKAETALDYVMLTSGWRRFTWEYMLENDYPVVKYKSEKAIIRATVLDRYSFKPVSQATITCGNYQYQTNNRGMFVIKNIDITENPVLSIKAKGYNNYQQTLSDYFSNKTIYLDPVDFPRVAYTAMQARAEGSPKNEAFGGAMIHHKEDNMNMKKKIQVPVDMIPVAEAELEKQEVVNLDPNKNFEGMRMLNDLDEELLDKGEEPKPNVGIRFYKARVFDVPDYSKNSETQVRNDFRKTIYWNPSINIDHTGKKEIEFYTGDDLASYRFVFQGIGNNGEAAYTEYKIFTQQPLNMTLKMPEILVQNDELVLPLLIKNNSDNKINGQLNINVPDELQSLNNIENNVTIAPRESKTVLLKYYTKMPIEKGAIIVSFKSNVYNDSFERNFSIIPEGYPKQVSFSGKETNNSYVVDIDNLVKGSIVASVTAYPSVVSDLMKGIESILNEPVGCFEQTSMSSYPNVLVKEYLDIMGEVNPKIEARANELIAKGYKRLITFETKEKGYEWFGGAPGHEALTAYGLMQFNDMKRVYSGVEQSMIDRTADWLMASKDGIGGYKRNSKALDNFGRADKNITDAYITFALACAKYSNIKLEINHLYDEAKKSKDPYLLGLAANALFAYEKDKRAQSILNELLKYQKDDGSFNGLVHSITRSTGIALKVETTSLAVLAMLQSDQMNHQQLNKAVDFLIKSRNGNGGFGNTQSTIMALKALTQYAIFNKHTNEDGVLEVYIEGQKVKELEYKAGERDAIVIAGLESFLHEGKNKIQLKYRKAKNPLPYSIAVKWFSYLPTSSKDCVVGLDLGLSDTKIKAGETVRLNVKIENKTNQGLPNTMVVVGIPGGCSVQPWQLKEMMDKKLVDFYEINGNKLNLYYRQMLPSEQKVLHFDLKSEIKGKFQSPAGSAYLYYTNEDKVWKSLPVLEII